MHVSLIQDADDEEAKDGDEDENEIPAEQEIPDAGMTQISDEEEPLPKEEEEEEEEEDMTGEVGGEETQPGLIFDEDAMFG